MSAEPDVADPDALLSADSVPQIRVAQMRRVDELMVDAFGVGLAQMMENAGRSLAELAEVRFAPRSVTVLAGAGNNGGGGLVAARHLANHGVRVRVAMAGLPVPGSLVERQLAAAVACGVLHIDGPETGDVVIDALVGYGLAGPRRGRVAELARWANGQPAPALALDGPSGLDLDSGAAAADTVRAAATMTLALPKPGLLKAPEMGELYLADISVPPALYRQVGLEVPPVFERGPVRRIRLPGEPALHTAASTLEWTTWWQALRLIVTGRTSATALRIALVVGTVLTTVNLAGPILAGHVTAITTIRIAANYVIPYVVSSLGVLSRTHMGR